MRRAKWENWKKTQAMFYCKTSTNYNKWDMFESETDSAEEEGKEPILPKNDPQFKAMEQDFKDRSQRRKRDKKLAEELKIKGNEATKRGLYKSAKHHYTEALELKRDYLQIYTNRALVCLKLDDAQLAIDDCTRVLEYCEVLGGGWAAQQDLCYKALMRRGQALKYQRDFKLAISDFEEARKLQRPDEVDADKWIRLTKEDQAHQEKIAKIMANAGTLRGKEYIDYLLAFLKGKKDEEEPAEENKNKKKRKQVCFHEVTPEECKKLTKTLEDQDMVYYFTVNDGFRIIVDSLYLSTTCLPLLQKQLESNTKLQDDFQREHLYEALIDFLQSQNQNSEGKTLAYSDMLLILQILETGSMNEAVRGNLSDKKKIKDLFLVVIRSIEIHKNKQLISSLVQFCSNLCYGTGKLKQMLAKEDSSELIGTLREILDKIRVKRVFVEDEDEDAENTAPNSQDKKANFERQEAADKSLLKSAIYALLGNLCADKSLRVSVANNTSGILGQVKDDFLNDMKEKSFDWFDMHHKQLAVFVNVSVEAPGQRFLFEAGVLEALPELLMACKSQDKLQREVLERILNLYSKMFRLPEAAAAVAKQRNAVFKIILYFSKEFGGELQLNALRALHALCKVPGFRELCFEEHKFSAKTFDLYVKEVNAFFAESLAPGKEDWSNFVNACGSAAAFVDAFPERAEDFQGMIKDLIAVVKDKTDAVRKGAAVLLAKLAKHEGNSKLMRELHGYDVLVSLRGAF